MNEEMIDRLEKSFKLLAPRGPELVDRFYAHLFSRHPALKPMFPDDMSDQKKKLLGSLVLVIENIRATEKLEKPLADMGRRHVGYGAEEAHYPAVAQTLLLTLAEFTGDAWTPEAANAWKEAVGAIAKHMLAGAARTTGQTSNANADN